MHSVAGGEEEDEEGEEHEVYYKEHEISMIRITKIKSSGHQQNNKQTKQTTTINNNNKQTQTHHMNQHQPNKQNGTFILFTFNSTVIRIQHLLSQLMPHNFTLTPVVYAHAPEIVTAGN